MSLTLLLLVSCSFLSPSKPDSFHGGSTADFLSLLFFQDGFRIQGR